MGKVRSLDIDKTEFASLADNNGHETRKIRVHLQKVIAYFLWFESPVRLSTCKQGRFVKSGAAQTPR